MQAVIFDVDGVLVDSYDAHLASWLATAREHDVPFTREDFDRTFGRTGRDIIRMLWPNGSALSDAAIRAIDEDKEKRYRAIVTQAFPAMDGAAELVTQLHKAGFRIAAGSSGPPENVRLAVERLGAAHAFEALVTGMDVTRGKPDPQVFLLAAERLGVPPARCVVVEDAPAGVEAAHRAGMKCVGLISTGRTPADVAHADRVVRSLRELTPRDVAVLLDGANAR